MILYSKTPAGFWKKFDSDPPELVAILELDVDRSSDSFWGMTEQVNSYFIRGKGGFK